MVPFAFQHAFPNYTHFQETITKWELFLVILRPQKSSAKKDIDFCENNCLAYFLIGNSFVPEGIVVVTLKLDLFRYVLPKFIPISFFSHVCRFWGVSGKGM